MVDVVLPFSNGIDFDEDFQPEFDEEEDETEDLSYLNMDLRKLDLESLDETELDAQLKALGIDSSNSQNLLAALNQREREALEELLNNEEIPVEVIKEEIKPTIYKYSQPFPAKPTAPLSKRTVIEEIWE